MALPKKKTSKSRSKRRFAQYSHNRREKLERVSDMLKHIDKPFIYDASSSPEPVKSKKVDDKVVDKKVSNLEKVDEIKVEKKADTKIEKLKDSKEEKKVEKKEVKKVDKKEESKKEVKKDKKEEKKEESKKEDSKSGWFSGLFHNKKGQSQVTKMDKASQKKMFRRKSM